MEVECVLVENHRTEKDHIRSQEALPKIWSGSLSHNEKMKVQ